MGVNAVVDRNFGIVVQGLAVKFEKALAFVELAFAVPASVVLACAVAYHGDEEALKVRSVGYKWQDLACRQNRS